MLQSESTVNQIKTKILNSKKIKIPNSNWNILKCILKTRVKLWNFWKTNTTWLPGLAKTMERAQDYTTQTELPQWWDTGSPVPGPCWASVSFSGMQSPYPQRHRKVDLFPNSYILFLQTASGFEDQMWVVMRNTQNLTGNTQPFSRVQIFCSPNPNFLRVHVKWKRSRSVISNSLRPHGL